jgi:hypothetical protein
VQDDAAPLNVVEHDAVRRYAPHGYAAPPAAERRASTANGPPMRRRDVIFVTGMGRSGTSALTRVLSLCGAALPLDVVQPNPANPAGFWEPSVSLALNDRFLEACGSSWFDVTLRPQPRDAGAVAALVDAATELLATGFEPDGPIVLKDPRIAALLPYWTEAAARAGLRVVLIHLFRQPDDVAASLTRRDQLPVVLSHALWLKYNLIPERDGRPFPRVFVAYEDVMTQWSIEIERCITSLELPLTISAAARREVPAFLSPELWHHSASRFVVHDEAASLVARTYALLNDAKRSGRATTAAFDAILDEYVASAFARHALRMAADDHALGPR